MVHHLEAGGAPIGPIGISQSLPEPMDLLGISRCQAAAVGKTASQRS